MIKNKKIRVLTILFFVSLAIIVIIPTFARLKNRQNTNTLIEWDGTISSSFHGGSGTINDPYIIKTASELAYLSDSLKTDDYANKYVKLSSDIILNKGVFSINTDKKYIYNNNEYYIDGENYYEDNKNENVAGTLNILDPLDNFKGHFDGDFHTIFGLYLYGDNKALFTNLNGELSNLYIDNSFINGGYMSSGVVLNAKNSIIKNIIFNGNVIGKNETKKEVIELEIDDITINDKYNLELNLPLVTTKNYRSVLKGECTTENERIFFINGDSYLCESFEIEVDPYNIEIDPLLNTITFSNLSYELEYDKSLSAGIVATAYNSIINGVVNKGNINNTNASGIVGSIYNTNISNSYNIGNIKGSSASGIVDLILLSDTINISNVYNRGILNSLNNSGLINDIVNTNTVNISNSFNTFETYAINNIDSSDISINNSFNAINISINSPSEEQFTLLSNLNQIKQSYPLYSDTNNITNGNIWIDDEYPILYFDDISNVIAEIRIDNNTWNNYSDQLSDIKYTDEISVLLATTNPNKPVKEAYYYLSNNILSKQQLANANWEEYNGIFTINDEGKYILYAKIVDYSDNEYYLNTDYLLIDLTGADVSIVSDNYEWNEYHNIVNVFIDNNLEFTISATDEISGISKIEYLVSSESKSIQELELLPDSNWEVYSIPFTITNNEYIIYVKVTDNSNYTTFINTDKMVAKNYSISDLKSGTDLIFNSNMTYNSSFNFNVLLNHSSLDNISLTRYIKTDTMLPTNTRIIIKDLNNNNVYEYKTTTMSYNENIDGYLYPLSNFTEVGKATFNINFTDNNYLNVLNEQFNVFIDFKSINVIEEDISFDFIAISNDLIIKLPNEISVNLYNTDEDLNDYLDIDSIYDGESVIYNTSDEIEIPLSLSLDSIVSNNITILNTTYEDLNMGIEIELVDDNDTLINRNNYQGIKFQYGNNYYFPDNNSVTNIDLGNSNSQNIVLKIISSLDTSSSINGTYYFKIKNYLSVDGKNKLYESDNFVLVPLEINKDYSNLRYSFDVQSISDSIVDLDTNNLLGFRITGMGELDNPKVRVSLYRKKELTAYNQEYLLVDLKNYINETLVPAGQNTYYAINNFVFNNQSVSTNTFNITLKNIELNGYKFVFELYDGNDKVGTKEINIIVR